MKKIKLFTVGLCALTVVSCGNATGNGALIGTGAGAALGAIIGKIAGNTAVGAAVGGAVGAGTGAIIGRHMDKVKAQAQAVQNAKVVEFAVAAIDNRPDVSVHVFTGFVGNSHLTTISVDYNVINRIYCTHGFVCFAKAKILKMVDVGNNEGYKVPLRGTFSSYSARTKLRGPSTLLHGLTDK